MKKVTMPSRTDTEPEDVKLMFVGKVQGIDGRRKEIHESNDGKIVRKKVRESIEKMRIF